MKYVIGALVVLALLFVAWWTISRGRQQKLDMQRTEAASIRAGAEERAASIRGQETFAQHADERAAVARHEAEERARLAEESAREAQRVEQEARAHQSELERTRLEHDAELRRADELDPDVEVDRDDPRPLPDDLDDHVRPLDARTGGDDATTDAATTDVSGSERVSDEDLLGGGGDAGSRTEGEDATHWPDGTDRVHAAEADSDIDADADAAADATTGAEVLGRRISSVDDIRDGGYGVGSAAPFEDGAQPFDHAVQAYRDTMTYRVPGASGYDSVEPDVWFYDEDAARRAGFTPSEG